MLYKSPWQGKHLIRIALLKYKTAILTSYTCNPSKGGPWTRDLLVHRSRGTDWHMSSLQRAKFPCDSFVL